MRNIEYRQHARSVPAESQPVGFKSRMLPAVPGFRTGSVWWNRNDRNGISGRSRGRPDASSGILVQGRGKRTAMTSGAGQPRVVIIGGGFGGIEAAKALKRAPVEVTVIDRQNHHCFQPLLYQVATAALSPADVAWPIRHILRSQENATVLMAEVRSIDTDERVVHADSISVPYDYLVLATGATHSYFG